MPISKVEWTKKPIHYWTDINEVEYTAQQQLQNVANLPWIFSHVAVMADVHYGRGCTVGSVIAMKDAVAPAAVGVDIGCGMLASKTNLMAHHLPDNLDDLRSNIEANIPVGFNSHEYPVFGSGAPEHIKREGKTLFDGFKNLTSKVQDLGGKASKQVGTLGGGNHFIEICLDTDNVVWLMLHSGSRNIGKELAEYHINIAKTLAHNKDLPDKDLAVFLAKTPEMNAYRHDLYWAQSYAFFNRLVMFELLKNVILDEFDNPDLGSIVFSDPIMCHHNYVSEENHFDNDVFVTRKGAISARKGELGIIPGSMGTQSYIVRGLGNADSFHSASHGAGRTMSRGTAKRTFTIDDLAEQTKGVCCRKDSGVLDEIPGAYKDIAKIMDNQRDLVEVVCAIKQVLCVKG